MVDCSDLELEESWIMTAAPWRWGVSLLILSEFYHILMVGACYQWQPLIHCLISSSLIRLVHNIVQELDVVMSTEQYNQNCDLNQDWFYFNSQRILVLHLIGQAKTQTIENSIYCFPELTPDWDCAEITGARTQEPGWTCGPPVRPIWARS